MQNFGFRIIPVRPAVSEVLSEKAVASLEDIDETVDLAVVFRNPAHIGPIVDSCIAKNIPVWLQDGVINEVEALKAANAGLFTVMNRCVYRDFSNLC